MALTRQHIITFTSLGLHQRLAGHTARHFFVEIVSENNYIIAQENTQAFILQNNLN
jgi:hypothetical protein